ncbi:MAG: SusC/RagA family TonB-linked outer membrane protein, partial [Muribaculaceae bacterium]|nr:SusC/RagA family TonB-linked outer membrane protein [Muribaculaceae bacterium]
YEEPTLIQQPGTTPGGSFTKYMGANDGWILRPQIDYNRTFGKHTVSALYVYEAQKNNSDSMQASAKNFAATEPIDLNLGVIIDETDNHPVGSYGYTSIVSHIGRLTYDYDNKYLFDFTFRYDGSYKFAPENRWGFFPSVSAGWVISSEKFLAENAPWIDFLKLRASWGKSGKDNITPYLFNATFQSAPNSIVFGSTLYKQYYTNSYLQRNLKWSTTETYDIGLDFDVLGRKLGLEFDVYYQYTNDLIQGISGEYAPSLGGNYPSQANIGSMDNRGLDFTIKHQLTVNKDFNYRLRGTFGFARNKVLRRNLSHNYPTTLQPRIGASLYARYGLKTNGLYRTEEDLKNAPYLDGCWAPYGSYRREPALGDIRYVDVNGDGLIRHSDNNTQVLDMVRIGYGSLPEIQFSLSGDFNYKNFYLNLLFQGVTHCDYMLEGNDQYAYTSGSQYTGNFFMGGNSAKYVAENSWTPENPNAKYPRLTTNTGGINILYSDYWMMNGEYLRLKNLTLGYNVPSKALSKTPFSAVNVYISGTNVFTLSHFKYIDPETPSASFNLYPQQQTWSLGLNVSF